jgi:starch synthase
MMKVLYVSSEALPCSKTGGLADVAGSLPQSLKRKGVDCRIVTPLYGPVSDSKNSKVSFDKAKLKFVKYIYVHVSWRWEYCGIFEANYDGVTYYLIDNEHYFFRDKLYGEHDDEERFAFFSRAALEILPHFGFKPDIIIANDWQAALVPIYQYYYHCHSEWYAKIKTIFTIHNIEFQQKCGFHLLGDVLDCRIPQKIRLSGKDV